MARISLHASIALALLAGSAAPAHAAPPASYTSADRIVRVAEGELDGVKRANGVNAYLGIPYAAPPIGPLRWHAPMPAAAWTGVRPAKSTAPICPQKARGPGQNFYFGADVASEDCLYLNVWTPPAAAVGAKLPVVVYIHGGGWTVGAGTQGWSHGEAMAAKGIIWVSINYRLGALGFLAHPELTAENGGHGSGNYALMDMIAALRWVQGNIGAFGGDRANVTLMGQSAGSMALALLQASPQAAGLFQREIGLSASPLMPGSAAGGAISLAKAEENGLAFQRAKGASSLAELREIPADDVTSAPDLGFGPVVDGTVLPQSPAEIFAAHRQNDAALLLSFTHDEAFNGLAFAATREAYVAGMRATYPSQADELLKRYPADDAWQANARRFGRDATLNVAMWNWAAAQTARQGKPAYGVMFSRVHPYTPGVTFRGFDQKTAGASHSSDIPYWVGTLDSLNCCRQTRDFTPEDRKLSDEMSDVVVAFARTGVPQTKAVPAIRFDPAHARMVELDTQIRVIDWPSRDNLPLLNTLPGAKIELGPRDPKRAPTM